MKTLLLLRHAKSSWDHPNLRDFDRPLNERGEADAPRIGAALAARGPKPDLVISSPAARARATVLAVRAAASLTPEVQFDDGIYGASSGEMAALIRGLPDTSSCVLLVGHNPTFESLVSRFTGKSHSMPTAALACVEFQAARWEDVEDETGKLKWLITPKTLA